MLILSLVVVAAMTHNVSEKHAAVLRTTNRQILCEQNGGTSTIKFYHRASVVLFRCYVPYDAGTLQLQTDSGFQRQIVCVVVLGKTNAISNLQEDVGCLSSRDVQTCAEKN